MRLLVTGPELDRQVALVLNGEAKGIRYSTDRAVSMRLVRRLERMGIALEIEEADGLAFCTLRSGSERLSTGSGETREIAVARAVVHCRFPFEPAGRPGSVSSSRAIRVDALSSPLYTFRCSECGEEVRRVRRQPTLPMACNLCGWKNAKSKALGSLRKGALSAR